MGEYAIKGDPIGCLSHGARLTHSYTMAPTCSMEGDSISFFLYIEIGTPEGRTEELPDGQLTFFFKATILEDELGFDDLA